MTSFGRLKKDNIHECIKNARLHRGNNDPFAKIKFNMIPFAVNADPRASAVVHRCRLRDPHRVRSILRRWWRRPPPPPLLRRCRCHRWCPSRSPFLLRPSTPTSTPRRRRTRTMTTGGVIVFQYPEAPNEVRGHVVGKAKSHALREDDKKKYSRHRVLARNEGWMP